MPSPWSLLSLKWVCDRACLSTSKRVSSIDETAARILSKEVSCFLDDGKNNLVIGIGLIITIYQLDTVSEKMRWLRPWAQKDIVLDSSTRL